MGWANLVLQKPDGYYISGINIPHIILHPLARGNAGYETAQIKPIALFQATPIGLAVLKDSEFKTLDDLVKYAKANPEAVTLGGSGTWSGHHIANLQLGKLAGIQTTYIPESGAAKSIASFLGGHVKAVWANSNDLVQHADKIRVLGLRHQETLPQLARRAHRRKPGVQAVRQYRPLGGRAAGHSGRCDKDTCRTRFSRFPRTPKYRSK